MRIAPEHIQEKAIAGKTKSGSPVLYVLTKGGLHAFFVKGDDGIESIGAAPHRAVAEWIAEKKSPGIEWSEDFAKSALIKSETAKFNRARELIFAPVPAEPVPDNGLYFVYDPEAFVIEIVDKSELCVKPGMSAWAFARPVNLSQPVDFLYYMVPNGRKEIA